MIAEHRRSTQCNALSTSHNVSINTSYNFIPIMKYSLLVLFSCIISMSAFSQSHWESIVLAENTWSYFEGNSEPSSTWNHIGFDDSGWKQGIGGLGYNDGDDATTIGAVSSLYMRKTFQVDASTIMEELYLNIDYDDGFVAYINGVEVARSSNVVVASPLYNSGTSTDREAVMYNGGSPAQYELDKSVLAQGENVLAVHILNHNATSSDLSALVYLNVLISSDAVVYQSTPSWFSEPVSYSSSNLPIVRINTFDQSIIDDPKITGYMEIVDNGYGNINYLTDTANDFSGYVGIETRGQSSQYFFPKKSFGFETRDEFGENLNVSLLGMPKENDWILYAPYSDKSMLRNVITFEMAKALDGYSSRTAFCEVFVDGSYEGIYVLMEKIKRDDSRVDVDSLLSINGDDNSLTGGYVFKVDKMDDDYVDQYSGWTTRPQPSYPNAMDITFQYVYPKAKDLESDERLYLKEFVTGAEEVLISSDFANKESGYNSYLNMGSFIDFMLIDEVTKEVDKYRYSNYFHKKKDSKGGEIFAGPIWDFNLGYGNVDYWDDGNLTSGWLFSDVKNNDYGIVFWWKRLMEDPYFESQAAVRYKSLRENEWSDENVSYLIDSIANYLDQAQQRNYTRWPILGTYVWPNKLWSNMDYNDEVLSFQQWILARLSWMDNNVSSQSLMPAVALSLSEQTPSSYELVLELTLSDNYFNHSVLKTKYFEIKGDAGLLKVDSVVYVNAQTANLLISKKGDEFPTQNISVQVDDNILTGFYNLEANTIDLSAAVEESFVTNPVKLFAFRQIVVLEVEQPALLGKSLSVYNIQGQLVDVRDIVAQRRNEILTNELTGVFIVSFLYNGKTYAEKVIF